MATAYNAIASGSPWVRGALLRKEGFSIDEELDIIPLRADEDLCHFVGPLSGSEC